MDGSEKSIRIRVSTSEDLDAARDLANREPELQLHSASTPSTGFEGQVEPITAILVGASVVAVAKFVMEWWDKRRGGLVIDQRETAVDDIYRDTDVPYGYLVIFPPEGAPMKVETRDAPKDSTQQLLELAVGGLLQQPKDVADAAARLFGKAAVTTEPGPAGL